jgi:large subunit ribosomal protein L25
MRNFSVTESRIEPYPFSVELRNREGSKAGRWLRANGLVPGVLYGSNWPETTANAPKISIQMSAQDIKKNLRLLSMSIGNTLFELDIEGESKQLAVIKQLQMCPLTDEPLCVNFLRYKPGTKVQIPVVYINDDASVDIKRGAYVVHINRFVKCVTTLPDHIPRVITADLTGLSVGDLIRLSDVKLPDGIVPVLGKATDLILGKVDM